ncbi:hypothetical protein ANN_10440 [Periplaneta americana]|uniref:Per a allergen n=1 Tax=Periplaneta americana TaxID=6978 RepID=A0ABQ8TPD2_PERAM|nr:hypothetical protein ANN_10440 [Periplaneta americana]
MDFRELGYDARDWINLAQDRDRWRPYVRAAMNPGFCKSHLKLLLYDIMDIPIVDVQGVLGRKTVMPCDITPRDRDDTVYMVLWFKEADGEPLYR